VSCVTQSCSGLRSACDSDHIWRRLLLRDAPFLFHIAASSAKTAESNTEDNPGALEYLFTKVPGMDGYLSWKKAYVYYCVQSLREPTVATHLDCRLSLSVMKAESEDDIEFERLSMPIRSIAVSGRNLLAAVGRELVINFGTVIYLFLELFDFGQFSFFGFIDLLTGRRKRIFSAGNTSENSRANIRSRPLVVVPNHPSAGPSGAVVSACGQRVLVWDIDSGRLITAISDSKDRRSSGSGSGMKILINDIAVIPAPPVSHSSKKRELSNPRHSADSSDAEDLSDTMSSDSFSHSDTFASPQLVVAGDTIKIYNLITGEVLKTIRSRTHNALYIP
jgi:hypothetical protein